MDYAVIENGVVTNIIWLYPGNGKEFPNAVPMDGVPVEMGDAYQDGAFWRDGQRVLSMLEQAGMMLEELAGGVKDVQQE